MGSSQASRHPLISYKEPWMASPQAARVDEPADTDTSISTTSTGLGTRLGTPTRAAGFARVLAPLAGSPCATKLVVALSLLLLLQLAVQQLAAMWSTSPRPSALLAALASVGSSALALSTNQTTNQTTETIQNAAAAGVNVDLSWYPPSQTEINNLTEVVNGTGIYGYIFNSSYVPENEYGVYNWCNMPHVRAPEYPRASNDYELVYVELIHRHHKRTVYAANSFPVESYEWNCNDEGLYAYAAAFDSSDHPADAYWQGYISPVNPFIPSGFIGTCQFPQITAAGLEDSWQHGADLYGVYGDLLGFLPARWEDWQRKVTYRVTQNTITSQVAGMVINAMWSVTDTSVPLLVEASGYDSLEPTYTCDTSNNLFNNIQSSNNPAWAAHLADAAPLYAELDGISGVPPDDSAFHVSFDHYYDNLSARQCHQKPLPCQLVNGVNSTNCVTQDMADNVYRFGNWEYSQVYRDDPQSLAASYTAYGVWVEELAAHLRAVINGTSSTVWYHNIAHDGSVSRLLGTLQVDVMVWPGMGSEVVFELYKRRERPIGWAANAISESGYYVRVLWGGQIFKSSNPSLGTIDMLPVETLLAYFDGLAGVNADLIVGKCNGSISV